ncbi:MAG: hypothetical protein QOC95_42, partial [Thermoleophilaceae bacterium]|nr:hypothetical protein [Thermoleophilaceae bacterium]
HIVCPAGSGGCKGTVTLELPAAVGHPNNVAAARRRMTRVGQAKFAAKAGTAPSVGVHLSRRGRQHMLRGIKARVGRVDVTTRSADGKAAVTSQSITLRPRRQTPPKRKPPKRGHK